MNKELKQLCAERADEQCELLLDSFESEEFKEAFVRAMEEIERGEVLPPPPPDGEPSVETIAKFAALCEVGNIDREFVEKLANLEHLNSFNSEG